MARESVSPIAEAALRPFSNTAPGRATIATDCTPSPGSAGILRRLPNERRHLIRLSGNSTTHFLLEHKSMWGQGVLISAPDDREGDEDVHEENKKEVVVFWRAMMSKCASEKDYNRQIK